MIEVKQGQIYVNNISLAVEADNFIVIHADLRAKYATFMVGHDSDAAIIYLYADETTLHKEDTDTWTLIRLNGYGAGDTGDMSNYWYWPLVEIGRYTLRAAVYRHPKVSEYLWTDNDK